jgi:hypothetical protein
LAGLKACATETFVLERLFHVDRANRLCRVDIDHPPWPIQDSDRDPASRIETRRHRF